MKIGYSCAPLTINARTDKRIVSKKFTNEEFIESLRENLKNLKLILAHNIDNDIHLFRISSDILDNSTHYNNSTDWTNILSVEIAQISNLIKNNDIRVTMFPQKYTLLNSPNIDVVKKSIAFLNEHIKFMKALKLDTSHKIILEIGGVYTNKKAAIERFIDVYSELSQDIKDRLILANDVKNYSFDDVLAICKILSAPMLFNTLYDKISKSNDLTLLEKLDMVSDTWKSTYGKMIIHYSQQNHSKKKGEQSDTIFTDKFIAFYNTIQKFQSDVTLESNDGDISALKCHNIIKELEGHKFTSKDLIKEHSKYKLLLIEKGNNFNKKTLGIATSTNSMIDFYKIIDESLESFIDKKGFMIALRDSLRLIGDIIKQSEKNHIEKLMLNNKLKRCKNYMYEIAIRNNATVLLETYFFSQL
ncbi:UV DNA damage repair endonuclease UvsE [uncultured Clostridium sp.]|jgi:UV DNA damage endonuclease|uniref:UV DNA damage repair endonuclease UvsE n=1 Tax=uncultured Clostridium sp. TaxID=59620 RepID=UPI00261529FB|nr:UV DNA damage repair endonuclease UvsE [uncultured Clostridium sp.]